MYNVKCKVISLKFSIEIKILRNNFNLLCLFLYCYDAMLFAPTQRGCLMPTLDFKIQFCLWLSMDK